MAASLKLRRQSEEERENTNPCSKECDLSMKCLEDNAYDRSKCKDYFKNYKNCKKFWSLVQSRRKRDGIEPALPPPEEREEVKRQHLPHLRPS